MKIVTRDSVFELRMTGGNFQLVKTEDLTSGINKTPVGKVWTAKTMDGARLGSQLVLKNGDEIVAKTGTITQPVTGTL